MAYISADGSVHSKPPLGRRLRRNPLRLIIDTLFSSRRTSAVVIGAIFIGIKFDLLPSSNPLANGMVPAASKMPHEHWSTISQDVVFVRKMTEALGTTKAETAAGHEALRSIELERTMDGADFGGPDGHVAEEIDWRDVENIRVTRCSTSRSAVTAYFCGAAVAKNQDAALGRDAKGWNLGIQSFQDLITCRFAQGERNGGKHRRSVYRLGIGCEDELAGYSHAFSLVSIGDGTYFWLQSFINYYSLTTWMAKADSTHASGLSGHLTYSELLAKLEKVERLMRINSWTYQANSDYLNLFGVDKMKEAIGRHENINWNTDHRLEEFAWDEACEYPLPHGYGRMNNQDTTTSEHPFEDNGEDDDEYDECAASFNYNFLEEIYDLMEEEMVDEFFDEDDMMENADTEYWSHIKID